jgi:CheY-like chemotaxis protein
MPAGGAITITTTIRSPDRDIRSEGLDDRLGEYVVMSVSDTGIGMTAETKANLFQPFFTTKDPARSRGLGLATVQEIVREAGGLLWVRSQPQAGTTVEVHFPSVELHPPAAEAAEHPLPPVAAISGNETILLVDDDAGVLRLTERGLELFGYRVLAAQSAAEATALAAERGSEIALLITDVMMPGQRGTGLAKELVAEWPHLKVLFMSGYPGEDYAEVGRRAAYLSKPFTMEELAGAARAALQA